MFGLTRLHKRVDKLQEEIARLKDPDYGYVFVLYSIQKDGSLERHGSTFCRSWAVTWADAEDDRCFLRVEDKL